MVWNRVSKTKSVQIYKLVLNRFYNIHCIYKMLKIKTIVRIN
jgi:hypothetical protein